MFKMIAAVFGHELKDMIRDTSTLKTMAILLVFMPVLYSYIMGDMGNRVQKVLDKDKRIGYLDQAEIQDVIPWLEQQGIVPVPIGERSKETFVKEKLDAILTVRVKDELDGVDKISTEFEVWTNGTNEKKTAAARFLQKKLLIYGSILARQNLIMAGAAPHLLEPIRVEVKPMEKEKGDGMAYNLLVALLGMALFFTTLHVAVDSTAGERERMTLESLLYTAAPRSSIVLGKFLFVAVVAFLGMVWTGTIFWVLGEVSIFQELLGRTSGFTLGQLSIGIAIMSPLCFLVAAMQILIGTLSNSVKQAQAYNSISGMMSLPLAFLFVMDQIKGLQYSPIFGQGLAFLKILQGEEWDPMALAGAQGITLLLALAMLLIVIQRFQNEKIILTKV